MGRFQEIVVEINTKQDVPRVRKMLVLMYVTSPKTNVTPRMFLT